MYQLQDDKAQLEGLLDAASVGVIQSSADGVILRVNQTFCEMLGYDEAELVGRPHFDFVHPDYKAPPEDFDRLRRGAIDRYERRKQYIRKDGTPLWTVVSVSMQQDAAGGPPYTVNVIRDITAQKRAEDELQVELNDSARLHEISTHLISSNNPDHLFRELVSATVDIIHADRGTLQLFNAETGTLEILAAHGLSQEMVEIFRTVSAETRSSCSEAMLCGGRVIVSDYEVDKPFAGSATAKAHTRAGIRAAQSTPLFSRSGRLVGMISTHWNKPHQPNDRQLRLVDILARQAADLIERTQAEDALRESEERFRITVMGSKLILAQFDKELRYLWIHAPHPDFDVAQVIGKRDDELEGSAGPRRLVDLKRQVIETGSGAREEVSFQRSDGIQTYDITIEPLRDSKGAIVGGTSAALDVSERKRAEELTRFQAGLLDAVEQAVVATDAQGKITYWNRFAEKMYGWRSEEVIGRDILEVTPAPEMERRAAEIMENLTLGQGWSGEFNVRRQDGSTFWAQVTVTPFRDQNENLVGMIGTSVDITERRQIQQTLQASAERDAFRLALSDAVRTVADPLEIQAKATQVLGERLCVSGVLFAEISDDGEYAVVSQDYYRGHLRSIAARYRLADYGFSIFRAVSSGNTIVLQDVDADSDLTDSESDAYKAEETRSLIVAPLVKDGRYVASLCVLSDVPRNWTDEEVSIVEETADRTWDAFERAKAQAALSEAYQTLEQRVMERTVELERLSEKLRLLANELTETEQRERRQLAEIIHDHLQQLLVAARMQINAMRVSEDSDSGELAASLLDQAIEQARTLTAQLRPPALYESGITSALKWLAGTMKEMHGLNVELDLDADSEPDLEQGAVLLFQSVRELLLNITKHAGTSEARVTMKKAERNVTLISVEDKGQGFDVAALEARAPQSGGFGLFSIRERMRAIGGECEIRSMPGEGTIVLLYVHVGKVQASSAAPGSALSSEAHFVPRFGTEQEYPNGLIRVVIADDHSIVRQGLSSIVDSARDMTVVRDVADGRAALEAAAELRPHIVIMDVNMPGMNGVQATRAIKETVPGVEVIGLSIHADEAIRQAMTDAGAKAYHLKDGPAESLMRSIRTVVDRTRSQPDE